MVYILKFSSLRSGTSGSPPTGSRFSSSSPLFFFLFPLASPSRYELDLVVLILLLLSPLALLVSSCVTFQVRTLSSFLLFLFSPFLRFFCIHPQANKFFTLFCPLYSNFVDAASCICSPRAEKSPLSKISTSQSKRTLLYLTPVTNVLKCPMIGLSFRK